MENKNAKKILKVAVVIYLASFLIINWSDISWIFNYKMVSTMVSDFFDPYPTISASSMDQYFYPNHSLPAQVGQETPVVVKEVKTTYTDKQNTLEIPKLGVSVPMIFSTNTSTESLAKDLDLGVIYYPGSVYPGQIGQIVILGHSAPIGWPKMKIAWAFSELEKLAPGDPIYINLNNKQYKYEVKQKTIVKRGADVSRDGLDTSKNVLTLISCWPPGKDYQRITVTAELLSS